MRMKNVSKANSIIDEREMSLFQGNYVSQAHHLNATLEHKELQHENLFEESRKCFATNSNLILIRLV
jgi:hypothetical protein